MRWGFTGSQKGTRDNTILKILSGLNLTKDDWVITGACIGIDTQVACLVAAEFPFVKQLIIYPYDRTKVSDDLDLIADEWINMPEGSNYRDRNERLVKESDLMVAFWTGKKAYSGTFMTINIAKRANKLNRVVQI